MDNVKISNRSDFIGDTEYEVSELLTMLDDIEGMDEALYQKLIKRLSQLTKQSKLMHKSSKQHLKSAKKLSLANKKYYYKLSKQLIKLIKDEHISDELKNEFTQMLREINTFVDQADQRDKEFLSTQHKKAISYGGLLVVTLAAIYGVKTSKK
ncbi:MAG: hypothetical protein ACRCST_13290 [Turicibacter sp.]